MALHTVSELKDSVSGLLSGIDLNNVDDLDGCLTRAVSTLVQKADVPEASGKQNITLYSGVFDYSCDDRIFGTAINDIRPQGITRSPVNFVSKLDQEQFDRTKGLVYPSGTRSAFEYVNGSPIIRIVAPFPKQQAIIDPMTAITGWTAAGSASALAQDTTVFYQSPASMRFTLTGSSTGTLTKTLTSSLDLSTYQNAGVAFLAIQIPIGATATNLTSIEVKLGSDSSNYTSVTSTAGFLGAWVAGEWLLVSYDYSAGTDTASPDWSAIAYVQVSLAHTATLTNFRVGGLWISYPTPAQILYQSAAIFLASGASDTTTTITANTDELILTDPAYNIYLQESALSVLQNTGASASDATSIKIKRILDGDRDTGDIGLYARYRGDNPSQEIRQTGTWYENEAGYNQLR